MTLLKTVAEVHEAGTADLLETFNHLTGGDVKRFASVEAGRRRVEMAMLAAKDADAKTGVPRGSEPQAKGRAEIEAKAAAKGVDTPESLDPEVNFPPGSMGDQLLKAAAAAKPIVPRPKKEPKAPAQPRSSIYAVQATFAGTSKPQAGSVRNNVLLYIQNAKNNAATIEAMDKHFQHDSRGYVNKLIEKDHLVTLTEEQYAAAVPTKK